MKYCSSSLYLQEYSTQDNYSLNSTDTLLFCTCEIIHTAFRIEVHLVAVPDSSLRYQPDTACTTSAFICLLSLRQTPHIPANPSLKTDTNIYHAASAQAPAAKLFCHKKKLLKKMSGVWARGPEAAALHTGINYCEQFANKQSCCLS